MHLGRTNKLKLNFTLFNKKILTKVSIPFVKSGEQLANLFITFFSLLPLEVYLYIHIFYSEGKEYTCNACLREPMKYILPQKDLPVHLFI